MNRDPHLRLKNDLFLATPSIVGLVIIIALLIWS